MTGHWLAAAIQTPEQIHLAWPAPSPAQPRPDQPYSGDGVKLCGAECCSAPSGYNRWGWLRGCGPWPEVDSTTITRPWDTIMKAGVSNYELQSAAGGGAGGSPVLCGLGFYIQIRAQPGSKVVISTLGLSLEALSLCTFISAESSLSMKHPFLSSQSHQNYFYFY